MTRLLDITPGYPLKYREKFRQLRAESPSGVTILATRWAYGRKEWDLSWPGAVRTSETDKIRDIINECRGGNEAFYWKEPNQTSRNRVYIGRGDGSNRTFVMPCVDWSFCTVRVNSADKYEGIDYDILTGAAEAGLDLIVFRSAVSSGQYAECDYTDGNLVPLVRLRGDFSHSLRGEDGRGDISVSIAETKEQ